MTATSRTEPVTPAPQSQITHIAAAVDSLPEGNDAVVLAAALTDAVGGDLMLVAIEPELPLFIPGVNRREMRRETETMLARTRESFAPSARSAIETDLSSARGLKRVLGRQHRQLVVCGSSRHGPEGEVSIGRTTRQLLGQVDCAMAIAPRGLSARGAKFTLKRIGVGFDGGAESREALSTAATLAAGAGAELIVCGVVDDRIPKLTWPNLWIEPFRESWNEVMDEEVTALRRTTESLSAGLSMPVTVQIERAVPAAFLRRLSLTTDLLVIGSRRWGTAARLLFGGTGEGLAHGTHCSLLVVPRPDDES
ncbi:MAG: universal stress protein [Solirubrobacteraceae bacterium]